MKNIIFKSITTLSVAGAMLLTGCNKLENFGSIDTNPYGSTQPVPSALLTNAQYGVGGTVGTAGRGTLYSQQISESQYTDASIFSEPKLDFGGSYSGVLMDLQKIINLNTDDATKGAAASFGSNNSQIAIAKILQTFVYWNLTDRYGDIPYSQALLGAGNLTPAYDKQSDIYPKLLTTLKDAITMLNGAVPVKGDKFYSGNEAQWKKLANTLRMLIALRMTKVDATAAQAGFTAAFNDANGYIAANADNLVLPYPGDGTYNNPWFGLYDGRTDYGLSKTIGDILNNMSDKRRDSYGTAGPLLPYGLTRDQAVAWTNAGNSGYSRVLAESFRTKSSPVVIISAATSLLAVAEGYERGWIAGGSAAAKTAYDAGVTQSFLQWGRTAAEANAVLTGAGSYTSGAGGGTGVGLWSTSASPYNSVPGQSAATTTGLQRIALQRYLAAFPDGTMAWSEWRRQCATGTPSPATAAAGIPSLVSTIYAANSGVGIPRRYVYGPTEYSTNNAAVAAAVARLTGGDVMQARIWWDK